MITIINERNGSKSTFRNYKKLHDHIAHNERSKRYNQSIDEWFFARHSYRRAKAFYDFICTQKEAIKQTPGEKNPKFDVLEICQDRFRKPVMVPITLDTDIESYLEDWCRTYCQYHGFKLVEIEDDDGILRVKKERSDLANIGLTYSVWWKE